MSILENLFAKTEQVVIFLKGTMNEIDESCANELRIWEAFFVALQKNGITQSAIAKSTGTSRSSICEMQQGKGSLNKFNQALVAAQKTKPGFIRDFCLILCQYEENFEAKTLEEVADQIMSLAESLKQTEKYQKNTNLSPKVDYLVKSS